MVQNKTWLGKFYMATVDKYRVGKCVDKGTYWHMNEEVSERRGICMGISNRTNLINTIRFVEDP